MPDDYPHKQTLLHVRDLLWQADRIGRFNRMLGTQLLDLSSLPVEFVEAVIAWSRAGDSQSD